MTTATVTETLVKFDTWGDVAGVSWNSASMRDRPWIKTGVYFIEIDARGTLNVAESSKKTSNAKYAETLTLAEYNKKTYELEQSRSVNFVETRGGLGIGKKFSETLAVSEKDEKRLNAAISEILTWAEWIKKDFELSKGENLQLTEYREGLDIGKEISEEIPIDELKSSTLERNFNASLAFNEALFQKELLKSVETLLGFLEENSAQIAALLKETFNVQDAEIKRPIIGFKSNIEIGEVGSKKPGVAISERLAVQDAMDRTVSFILSFAEAIKVVELGSKKPIIGFQEALKVVDSFLRKADAALVDMVLSSLADGEDITLSEFESLIANGPMPGYTRWKDFMPGDYEYTKALFRTIVASKTSDRAQLRQVEVAVDVPDLYDKGTVTITNANTGGVVEFNRDFHVIPDVTLSARGGASNPTVPEFLTPPNLNGFAVRLRDSVTGSYVTGSFTWTAIGY